MTPIITNVALQTRGKGTAYVQRCWHVSYQFCGLAAEITVCAQNEAEARAKALDQLRHRGLKVA